MPRFIDSHVFRQEIFSLGREAVTGEPYLSTPVSGAVRAADAEAYFRISEEEFRRFASEPAEARDFVEACRMGRSEPRRIG